MTVGRELLREAVLAVSHVPGVAVDVTTAGGVRHRISDREGDRAAVDTLRSLLADEAGHEVAALEVFESGIEAVAVKDDPPVTVRRSRCWWQHRCICGLSDYFVSDLQPERTERVAGEVLQMIGESTALATWSRWDPELSATVLHVERPHELSATDVTLLNRRLATLAWIYSELLATNA